MTLGLLARAARIERLTAALLFALATGAILFAASGVSIFVVRQIPAGVAFTAATRIEAVYVAAALAGLGGALMGARRSAGRRWPIVLACFVAASGLLDVASAITPAIDSRLTLIEDATPNVVPQLASALVVPAGLLLIVLARGLWRRRRRAWQLALALLVGAAVLHLLKGLDYEEAAVNLLLALALVARRHDFAGPGDPRVRVHLVGRALLWFGAIFAYGFIALWVNRLAADQPFTLPFALRETGESLIGMELAGRRHITGEFGQWFPLSVLLLAVTATFTLLWAWLSPWRYRLSQERRERERAHALVESFGIDTLAPFALRADKSYFFSEDERAFLAYKVVAGVAVVSGDPVGPEQTVHTLLPRFLAFARSRDWRIAVLGAGDRYLELYRQLGLRTLYHGEEAVVHTAEFSLEGRAVRKVRQSVSRLEREGYQTEVLYARDVHDQLRAELQDIFEQWRGEEPTKGFTMELDTLFRLEDDDAAVRRRPRRQRHTPRIPPLRRRASGTCALAFLDAAPPRHPQRLQRVAGRDHDRLGANTRVHARLAQLRPLRRRARTRSRPGTPARRGSAAARTEDAQRPRLPAREPPPLQPQVLPPLGTTLPRLRTTRRPAPRRSSGASSRGLPLPSRSPSVTTALAASLLLAAASAVALNWGFFTQHQAANSGIPELSLRHPVASLAALFSNLRWLAGFAIGIGGWGLYIAALRFGPLSLVQAVSAGGVGLLALFVSRISHIPLDRREWSACGSRCSASCFWGSL